MLEVHRAIRIPASVEDVFRVVADYRYTTQFIPYLVRFEPIGRTTYGLGARFRWEGRLLGFTAGAEFEVTRFEDPRLMEAWTIRGPHSYARWQIQPVEGGARACFSLGVEIPGGPLFRLIGAAAIEDQMAACMEEALLNLRALVCRERVPATAG